MRTRFLIEQGEIDIYTEESGETSVLKGAYGHYDESNWASKAMWLMHNNAHEKDPFDRLDSRRIEPRGPIKIYHHEPPTITTATDAEGRPTTRQEWKKFDFGKYRATWAMPFADWKHEYVK